MLTLLNIHVCILFCDFFALEALTFYSSYILQLHFTVVTFYSYIIQYLHFTVIFSVCFSCP